MQISPGSEVDPSRAMVVVGRWLHPTDSHLRCPHLLPQPSYLPLATPPQPAGIAGARAAWGRHSPPRSPAPAPQEQAQQDALWGSLEAFREEHSPGTSPAGKEVSWVCHSICRSPDSRPQRLSTNGVCVGADGRRASWRQEAKGEGQAVGEWQQVGWSAEWCSGCKFEV